VKAVAEMLPDRCIVIDNLAIETHISHKKEYTADKTTRPTMQAFLPRDVLLIVRNMLSNDVFSSV